MSVNVLARWRVENGTGRREEAYSIVHFDLLKLTHRCLGLSLVWSHCCGLAEAQVLWDIDVHGDLRSD